MDLKTVKYLLEKKLIVEYYEDVLKGKHIQFLVNFNKYKEVNRDRNIVLSLILNFIMNHDYFSLYFLSIKKFEKLINYYYYNSHIGITELYNLTSNQKIKGEIIFEIISSKSSELKINDDIKSKINEIMVKHLNEGKEKYETYAKKYKKIRSIFKESERFNPIQLNTLVKEIEAMGKTKGDKKVEAERQRLEEEAEAREKARLEIIRKEKERLRKIAEANAKATREKAAREAARRRAEELKRQKELERQRKLAELERQIKLAEIARKKAERERKKRIATEKARKDAIRKATELARIAKAKADAGRKAEEIKRRQEAKRQKAEEEAEAREKAAREAARRRAEELKRQKELERQRKLAELERQIKLAEIARKKAERERKKRIATEKARKDAIRKATELARIAKAKADAGRKAEEIKRREKAEAYEQARKAHAQVQTRALAQKAQVEARKAQAARQRASKAAARVRVPVNYTQNNNLNLQEKLESLKQVKGSLTQMMRELNMRIPLWNILGGGIVDDIKKLKEEISNIIYKFIKKYKKLPSSMKYQIRHIMKTFNNIIIKDN